MTLQHAIATTEGMFGPRYPKPSRIGKVRDIYDLGDRLLIIATDRISAFDMVLDPPIPSKGSVLTGLTKLWLQSLKSAAPHHLVTTEVSCYPEPFCKYGNIIAGQSMLVLKADEVIPVECVVRGYLLGSAWKEYQANGTACGIPLPEGMVKGQKLPGPFFTPSTKTNTGHDENITLSEMKDLLVDLYGKDRGLQCFDQLPSRSINLFLEAQEYASQRGMIIADTKFEFGWLGGEIILIDEVLTPDSSRFLLREDYERGNIDNGLDKQPVRDYLNSLGWDHNPPAPELPVEVVAATRERYMKLWGIMLGQKD